ncbi:MAG: hypothetical protein EYC70_06550 [Planctomycetota bacterium]|nr:MAG: hypothetical protein EYC70_06550 [Planctomycetota bacterium]
MSVRSASILPAGAGAARFQPRLWLAFAPVEGGGGVAGSAQLWGLYVCNGGPELAEVVVELHALDTVAEETIALGTIHAGGCAWVFAGGPSERPPTGVYRVWAKGLGGAPVFLEVPLQRWRSEPRPADAQRRGPGLAVAPAGAWLPSEYVRVLESGALLSDAPDVHAAGQAFATWWSERLETAGGILSPAAAKEAVWAGIRAVFGAAEAERERADVSAVLERLGARFEGGLRARMERLLPRDPQPTSLAA